MVPDAKNVYVSLLEPRIIFSIFFCAVAVPGYVFSYPQPSGKFFLCVILCGSFGRFVRFLDFHLTTSEWHQRQLGDRSVISVVFNE